MSDLIKTTVIKPHMGPDGVITTVGQQIEVDERRYKDLARKGYVASETTAAEEPAAEVKEGITNADFQPKRTPISGSVKSAPKTPAKSSAKPKRKA
ncbi:hypothetical protein [Mesorhizobium sp. B1-1-7]|uniref:hypothetical protein n=1 Tax=Mesorhizobium sp. B1-1-7 TaxID=2589977 RepID=UPI00112D0A74|nr:hypothetical protein [Mesorhizobium sp. B1-1-7]TPN43215.1 hypothetical protein FJ978_31420 [Mesorhizobium sp. B1-1-7]